MNNGKPRPADEIIYPEQITTDFLHGLFVSAYLNVHLDDENDIYIKERFKTWVFPQSNGSQIRFMAQFRANEERDLLTKFEYVNLINDRMRLLRAYVDSDGDIGFDYFLPIEGGVSKRNIVITLRTFIDYVITALSRDEQNIIA